MWKKDESESIQERDAIVPWVTVAGLVAMSPGTLTNGWAAEAYLQYVISYVEPVAVEDPQDFKDNGQEIIEQLMGAEHESYFEDADLI